MLSQKRRKKRALHGVKTIELNRSKHGYGFTISGQQPCVLGNIVQGSPADDQGLRDGDHLISVNSLAVAQLTHEQVVRIIGSSSGILRLQIAENRNSSDSSDEEYVKPRYTHRNRARSGNRSNNHVTATVDGSTRKARRDTHSPSPAQPSQQLSLSVAPPLKSDQRRHDPFPTIYNPTRAINGRSSDFGVVRHAHLQERRVGDFYRPGFSGQSIPAPGLLVRSTSEPDVSAAIDAQGPQENITPHGLSNILYPAMQPAVISSSSTINNEDDQPSLRVIVGYIGSIEMPQDSNLPSSRLQSIRSAVRRLRVEKKVHTLVLLEIRHDGIRLINPMGATIVHYPVKRLAMSGMYPDDKRFFGLVTIQEKDEEDDEEGSSSSCHVFMVDPELCAHNVHAAKAKSFSIHCTIDPNTHRCIEFPKSCTPILRTAARLYRDRHGGIFEVPRNYNEHHASSDSDSGSDSGLGFHKDQDESNNADGVYVVHVHIPDEHSSVASFERVASPAGASGLQRSQTPIKSSPVSDRSSSSQPQPATRGPSRGPPPPYRPPPDIQGPHRSQPPPSHSKNPMAPMTAFQTPMIVRAKSVTIGSPRGNVLDIRASTPKFSSQTLDVRSRTKGGSAMSPAAVTQSPLDPNTVEQLRKNMQRLLQKRQENIRDTQSLSDTESMISDTSRVSFRGKFAVHSDSSTTSARLLQGAVGGASTSSESLEMSRRPAPRHNHNPLYPEHTWRQTRQNHVETTPNDYHRHPPVPSKPTYTAQRAVHQQNTVSRAPRIAPKPSTRDKIVQDVVPNNQGCGDQAEQKARPLEQMRRHMMASQNKKRSLDSKLSPRAYPITAPKPAKVSVGNKSAFQRVSPEGPEFGYYEQKRQHAYPMNYNNNNSDIHAKNGTSTKSTTRNGHDQRPVPAPRPRSVISESSSVSVRSSSVPPALNHTWQRVGREVNVDDGMSIRSGSLISLDNGPQDNHTRGDNIKKPLERISTEPHSLSIESLLEVGSETRQGSHTTLGGSQVTNNNVGRVACWAVSFENLLQDEKGMHAFTEFLTKEYSQENIEFWLACQQYKECPAEQRKEKAKAIFDTHLSKAAPEPVNIDSRAMRTAEEQLADPSSGIFNEAQQQVFTLMKTDSYTRFIKSEFYQTLLMREFEGESEHNSEHKMKNGLLDASDSDNQKKRSMVGIFKDISKTLTKGNDGSKNRPGFDGNARKQWSRSSGESTLERSSSKVGIRSRKLAGSMRANLDDMRRQLDSGGSQDDQSLKSESEDGESRALVRILLPSGATSVIQARHGDTLRNILTDLLSRKTEYTVSSIDVFILDSDKALDLSLLVADLGSHELRVEKRALFRLDLPNRKSIGVKAKPQRTIRDVLRPILNKYGFNIDDMVVLKGGESLKTDEVVITIDGLRLTIQPKEDFAEWGFSKKQVKDSNGEKYDDLVDFENSGDLKKLKSSGFFGLLKNNSVDERGFSTKKSKSKVTFGPAKSMDDRMLDNSRKTSKDSMFLDMLTKAQNSRFDDQRGVGVDVGDLPDFLKSTSSNKEEIDSSESRQPLTSNRYSGSLTFDLPNDSAQYSDGLSPGSSENADGSFYIGTESFHHTDSNFGSEGFNPEDNSDFSGSNNSVHITDGPTKHNNSYRNALGLLEEDNNGTIVADDLLDVTITPGHAPLSPVQTTYPPPPQFGNEATNTSLGPPPYSEALSRSSFVAAFNSDNTTSTPTRPPSMSTLPGTRLSFAQQPMIINDNESVVNHHDDRYTPSPTTHLLVLTPEEQANSHTETVGDDYTFYQAQYRQQLAKPEQPTTSKDAMKITFV